MKNTTTRFKKGMVLAMCVEPGERADSGSVMVIDTSKLGSSKEDKEWLKAIKEEFEKDLSENDGKIGIQRGQQTFPWDWEPLEKASVEKFPVQIDGAIDVFYGTD